MSGDGDGKWTCEYCTYKNWPATRKCVLCQGPKPAHFVVASSSDDKSEEHDIYKVASRLSRPGTPPDGAIGQSPSSLCSELKVDTNVTGSPVGSGPTSPVLLPGVSRSPTPGKKNRSPTLTLNTHKWLCKSCTLSNWPRAKCCVICGTTRGKTYAECHGAVGGGSRQSSPPVSSDNSPRGRDNSSDTSSPPGSGRSSSKSSPPGSARVSDSEAGAAAIPDDTRSKRTKSNKHKQNRPPLPSPGDRLWLSACQGVVSGDAALVNAYLSSGANLSRHISRADSLFLGKPTIFQVGSTLIHLALSSQSQDILQILLAATETDVKATKRLPNHVSPDIAINIRRHIWASLRQRKGDFPCFFVQECVTFCLPSGIMDLSGKGRRLLLDEMIDKGVQTELEDEECAINWSRQISRRLGSKLFALWNRTAGDCLLDSALQATWGVFDQDGGLRQALAGSLQDADYAFYERWRVHERRQQELDLSAAFSLDELQWQRDWHILLKRAQQPGQALEQIHIFALAHILRRPIIVYSVKFINNFRGEPLTLSPFAGVYLPLLWERSFCWCNPIALGFTRGHFSALVTMATDNEGGGARALSNREEEEEEEEVLVSYLPLVGSCGTTLPVHFLMSSEVGREELLLRNWLECCVTEGGVLVAKQRLPRPPPLVRQMLDTWLDRYRHVGCERPGEGGTSAGESEAE